MPLLGKGSLFAHLQSLAMGGAGAKSFVLGGALGGGLGAAYLKEFCYFVDHADPDSAMGMAFDASEAAVVGAIQTKEDLMAQCASSETCAAVTSAVADASETALNTISSVWNGMTSYVSQAVDNFQQRSQLKREIKQLE
eukprot:2560663-Ditylum_brightwellii.AAC.1